MSALHAASRNGKMSKVVDLETRAVSAGRGRQGSGKLERRSIRGQPEDFGKWGQERAASLEEDEDE